MTGPEWDPSPDSKGTTVTPFPPPTPPAPIGEPDAAPPSGSRRRLVIAAVAATAIGVGGVVAGSQLVAADDENTTGEPAPTDEAEPIEDEQVEAEPVEDEQVDTDPADQPIDNDSDDEADSSDDEHDGDWKFPALDELQTSFSEFEQCLAEQLPDLEDGGWMDIDSGELPDIGDWDTAFEDLLGGSVTVFAPGAADGDLTLLDFGDGDGTITITQTDGEIVVSTDGDVDTVDAGLLDLAELPDIADLADLTDLADFEFEPDPEVEAAFEDCVSTLPGNGMFDMVGDLVGDFVGQHD